MINYLYYKLYQASLKSSIKGVPHLLAPIYLGGLVALNLIVISAFLAKIDIGNFIFKNSTIGGGVSAFLMVVALSYYNKRRRDQVLKKYSGENEDRRKRGNAVIWIYVILTFLSIFAVGLYKPGKI